MEKKLSYLIFAAMLFLSTPLWALTDSEVEARLDQYAAKIKALEAELANAKQTPVYEQDVGKASASNSKLEKQIQQIKTKMDADQQRFKVNGFMTAAVAVADEKLGTDYQFNDKPNFTGDSKMGLQFVGNMDEKTSATVQLLARSRGKGSYGNTDSWNVAAEWAYLSYKATDDLTLRMGKLRVPFYMYSETLDVGYSYPWVRPPIDMYTTVFTAYNGADLLYKFNTGPVNSTFQVFTGASKGGTLPQADTSADISLQDMYGVNLTSNWGPWTARLMATTLAIRGTATVTRYDTQAWAALPFIGAATGGTVTCIADDGTAPGVLCNQWTLGLNVDDRLGYYSGGLQYDDGSLFVITEAAHLDTWHGTLFGNSDQHYITGGYRFGSWTPYATYGHSYDVEGATQTAMKSRSVGLRKEVSPSMSAKLELNTFYDFERNGGFSQAASLGNDANVLTFALDAVF